jgi:hypothetical protein
MLEIRPATSDADLTEIARMRAVNRRLGYQPQPDEVGFRGPLWPPRQATEAEAR